MKGNGNGNKFRLTTSHNNSTTSPVHHEEGKHIKYIKYKGEGG